LITSSRVAGLDETLCTLRDATRRDATRRDATRRDATRARAESAQVRAEAMERVRAVRAMAAARAGGAGPVAAPRPRGGPRRRAAARAAAAHQSWPSSDHSRGGRMELRMSSVCEPGLAPAGLPPLAPAFFVVFTSTGGSYLTSEAVGVPLMAATRASW
jgi:hypothetical protein